MSPRNISSIDNAGTALLLQLLEDTAPPSKAKGNEKRPRFQRCKGEFPLNGSDTKGPAGGAHSIGIQDPEICSECSARHIPRRTAQRRMGLRKLSLHSHRGQPDFGYVKNPKKTRRGGHIFKPSTAPATNFGPRGYFRAQSGYELVGSQRSRRRSKLRGSTLDSGMKATRLPAHSAAMPHRLRASTRFIANTYITSVCEC